MKTCKKCLEEKDDDQFHKSTVSADRLYEWCKDCSRVFRKEYNMKNAARLNVYYKEYRKDPEHAARHMNHVRARQSMQKEAYNSLSIEERRAMTVFYKHCPKGHVVDHIYPIIKGGLHCLSNLQYLLPKDNRDKWKKVPSNTDIDGTIICWS